MVKVDVTEEDITRGVRGSCTACPVALALRRATGTNWASVDDSVMESAHSFNRAETPPEVVKFIYLFDAQGRVEPFSFEVDLS